LANNNELQILAQVSLRAPTDAEIEAVKQKISSKLNTIVKTKGQSLTAKMLSPEDADIYIKKMQNSLDRMKFKTPKIFDDANVKTEIDKLNGMLGQLKLGKISTKEIGLQFDNVKTKIAEVSSHMKNVNKDGYSFIQMIELAAKKIAIWGISTMVVYGSLKKIKEGFEFIKDLDKDLTNIRIVTGATVSEMQDLATSYNNLAKTLGATTGELLKGATEWYRQGKTTAEAQELVTASIIESKLAAISSSEATEYLTSVLNGFQLPASAAVSIIDKLVAVDNAAATSVSELSLALQRSSNSAREAGVPIERLIGYIGTVSSVTRKSASSIGESFLDFTCKKVKYWNHNGIIHKPLLQIDSNIRRISRDGQRLGRYNLYHQQRLNESTSLLLRRCTSLNFVQ
jgi:hypothetical protein